MNYKKVNTKLLGNKIRWIDRNGYYNLSNGIVIKIMLTTRGRKDCYTGYKLVVISKSAGIIDGKFFNFKEFLMPINPADEGKQIFIDQSLTESELDDKGNKYVGLMLFNINVTEDSVKNFYNEIYQYINIYA